jgi:hypothetical protein
MEYTYFDSTKYKRDYTYKQLKNLLNQYMINAPRIQTFIKLLKMKRKVLKAFIETENSKISIPLQQLYSYSYLLLDCRIQLDLMIDEYNRYKHNYETKHYSYENFSVVYTVGKAKRTIPEEDFSFYTPITEPILIAPLLGQYVVIDGNHRLHQFILNKKNDISAYVLTVEQTNDLLPDKFSKLINSFFAIDAIREIKS